MIQDTFENFGKQKKKSYRKEHSKNVYDIPHPYFEIFPKLGGIAISDNIIFHIVFIAKFNERLLASILAKWPKVDYGVQKLLFLTISATKILL